ncbi:MAG TPA: glycosyltransferase, partial [Chitinophagaceae bacterium]|nr:glycosyltransferase [Chitinophagaceae bacterium]
MTFSIIIPTYNRPEILKECLHALEQLNYPKEDMEIIISDDGSADINQPIVNLFSNLPILFISGTNSGPATARNRGARMANGDWLVFIDDDCRPDTAFLSQVIPHLQTGLLLGGKTTNIEKSIYSTASQVLVDYIYRYFNKKDPVFFTSNNMVVSKNIFLEKGGFDETFPLAAAEDRQFCREWIQSGKKLKYIPAAIIYHAHHLTRKGFWKQQKNYGRGAKLFHKVVNEQGGKIPMEGLGFYFGLLFFPFRIKGIGLFRRFRLSGLMFISQLANISGYFSKSYP